MKQPLTGHDRIHADIIIERIRELGFRFERRRLLQRITEEASVQKIQLERHADGAGSVAGTPYAARASSRPLRAKEMKPMTPTERRFKFTWSRTWPDWEQDFVTARWRTPDRSRLQTPQC